MSVDSIIDRILTEEGERFTNNPEDSGGPTKWGVTLATYSAYLNRPATVAELQALTRDVAAAVLRHKYVEAPGFTPVLAASDAIGAKLVDAGVNMGQGTVTQFLQRCLNAFNLQGRKYPDVHVDGQCGAGTVAALRAFLAWRGAEGERVMLEALNCLQGERYIEIAEKRPKDEEFVYGWIKDRVSA